MTLSIRQGRTRLSPRGAPSHAHGVNSLGDVRREDSGLFRLSNDSCGDPVALIDHEHFRPDRGESGSHFAFEFKALERTKQAIRAPEE